MLLNELLHITPSTTPIWVYEFGNPSVEPIINLAYSDGLLRGNVSCSLNAEIRCVSSQVINGVPYLTISIKTE